jgi:alginate O-acetyltransferase complex protein AlgI
LFFNYALYLLAGIKFTILLFLVTVFTFIIGRLIDRNASIAYKRSVLSLGILCSLGLLGYSKYLDFFIDQFQRNTNISSSTAGIILPLGISFYIFKCISYLVDVYRTKIGSATFSEVSCYITLFPQIIAGPIDRSYNLIPQLRYPTYSLNKFAFGLTLFILGLAKKALIADNLSSIVPSLLSAKSGFLGAWLGLFIYSLQIYIDFSAYSDMAIGIGQTLGFNFQINFNYPYKADSIQDFWRRWHISLSTWLREYLYFPLGGSRAGQLRTYLNLFIIMAVCGFWHGAKWTFIIWGAYHGIALAVERFLKTKFDFNLIPKIVRQIVSFFIVMIGWLPFYSNSTGQAKDILIGLIGGHGLGFAGVSSLNFTVLAVLVPAIIVSWFEFGSEIKDFKPSLKLALATTVLFIISLGVIFAQTSKPFLYAKF